MRPTVLAILASLAVMTACRPAEAPIVLLISIDGWRWDYLDRLDAPFLRRLAARGVRSEGLVPVFPSLTFPNHYTVVTGLRPARHGIISNSMVDAGIPGRFTLSDREVMADPRWWGGEPIWQTGERHGQQSGAMFWPGSEVAIHGRHPTYWRPFDDDLPPEKRTAQILEWLALPEPERPTFLTLYFSDVDSAGHTFGPESPELAAAAARVDGHLAELAARVDALGLGSRVHWIVVSDHGMAELAADRVILLDDFIDLETVDVVDWTALVSLSPTNGDVDTLVRALERRHPAMTVYRREDLPERFGLRGHPRLPAVVGLADEGWMITSRPRLESRDESRPWGGAHGFDPAFRSMHGLFIAAGPKLRQGLRVPPFENVHIYELMCAILGWTPAPNEGDPAVTAGMLR
jgi:predicted AlkP superfamily pyrophosphatase or phosphodiesterase